MSAAHITIIVRVFIVIIIKFETLSGGSVKFTEVNLRAIERNDQKNDHIVASYDETEK